MRSFAQVGAWFLYAAVMVLFLGYFLFPTEDLRFFVQKEILHRTGIEAQIEGLSLHFPATLTIKTLDLQKGKSPLISLDSVDLKPSFFAFLSGKVGGQVDALGFGGSMEAALQVRPAFPLTARGHLGLENLDMERLIALSPKPLLFGIKGALSGRFICTPEEESLLISGVLNFKGGDLILHLPMVEDLGLKLISVQLESRLQEKALEIKELLLSGSFGTLQLQGTISPPVGPGARLNLSGGIRPDPSFLQKLTRMGGIGPVIGRFVGKQEIPVVVSGTLERPQVSLAGMRL